MILNRALSYFTWPLVLSVILTAVFPIPAKAQFSSERAKTLLTKHVTHHGPNCWNSALVVSGVLPHFRFTSAVEFEFLVDSPACQRILPGQQQYGDIQIYRRTLPGLSLKDREVHANIWLDQNSAFNKMTDFATSAYQIAAQAEVNKTYMKTAEMLAFTLIDGSKGVHCQGEYCDNHLEYRRCDGIAALKKSDSHYNSTLENLIISLEARMEIQVQNPRKASALWSQESLQQLTEIKLLLSETCRDENSFYCTLTQNAIDSLHQQLTRTQPNWLE